MNALDTEPVSISRGNQRYETRTDTKEAKRPIYSCCTVDSLTEQLESSSSSLVVDVNHDGNEKQKRRYSSHCVVSHRTWLTM